MMGLIFGDILDMVFMVLLRFEMLKAQLIRFGRRLSEQIDACRTV